MKVSSTKEIDRFGKCLFYPFIKYYDMAVRCELEFYLVSPQITRSKAISIGKRYMEYNDMCLSERLNKRENYIDVCDIEQKYSKPLSNLLR